MLKYVTAFPCVRTHTPTHTRAQTTHTIAQSAKRHNMYPESFQTQRYATERTQSGVAVLLVLSLLGKLVKKINK